MTWAFVVVSESTSIMADFDRCFFEIDEPHWHGLRRGFLDLPLAKDRMERILGEDMFDVGDQQFLVLLLVVHAENQDRLDFREEFFVSDGKKIVDV